MQPDPGFDRSRPWSTEVLARDGSLLRLTLASDERFRVRADLSDYPPELIEALMLKEDRWFRWHPGVNPASTLRAAWHQLGDNGSGAGASTLTMQLVRIESGMATRSYAGKLRQMARAVAWSIRHDKDTVLAGYLNLAPMAGNVEGFATASLVYFGKPVHALNRVEILTLAVLPQRPKLAAHPQGLQLGASSRAARLRLFEDWVALHPEDERFRSQIESVTVLRRPADLPFGAPHAVDQALRLAAQRGSTEHRLGTSIDPATQRIVEVELKRYLKEQSRLGFTNGSVLLVDTIDGDIRAMVGSADYFDASIGGQINGTAIQRSPGSTLKPLLYALAVDQGKIHPASVLRDVPTRFGHFSPENFDGDFVGPITAQEALIRSRNIPAVQIASRLEAPGLYGLLRGAEVQNLQRESHYGLALVLGGGALSAQELAGMYGALARNGRHRRVSLLAGDEAAPSLPLVSPEAAFIVRDMLTHNPRPDGQSSRVPVAWKTGTSWGFHDAWTAGIVGRFVLIVWLGTPDHAPQANLIGVQAAAPLFFRIVDVLSGDRDAVLAPVDSTPLNVRRVAVCEASGELPNPDCPRTVDTWFIPGKTSIATSTMHRRVTVDVSTGDPVCRPAGSPGTRSDVFVYWPSELREARLKAGIRDRTAPDPSMCGAPSSVAQAPIIKSPRRGGTYLLAGPNDRIGLMASADSGQSRLYWYADGALVGISAPEQTLDWRPARAGSFVLTVSDAGGNTEQRQVRVGFIGEDAG